MADPGTSPPRARSLAFAYLFAFFTISLAPFPLYYLPEAWRLLGHFSRAWTDLLVLVARRVLGIDGPLVLQPTGSGDRTIDYVQLLVIASLSAVIAVGWSLASPAAREKWEARLRDALRIYLRYYLAATMFGYGFAKVFKTQFPFPSPEYLMHTYGESSPMNLLWTFMGYSTAYTVFAGLVEVTGGLLLLFRRTTTLGALVITGAMTNIVMLNFSYDVAVKIGSLKLLAIAMYIASKDAPRLANVLVLNRAAPADERIGSPEDALAGWGVGEERSKTLRGLALALKWALIAALLYYPVTTSLYYRKIIDDSRGGPLAGAYKVEAVAPVEEGAARDGRALRRISIAKTYLVITREDDTRVWYQSTVNTETRTIVVKRFNGDSFEIAYEEPDTEHLVLRGRFPNESDAPLTVTLRKVPIDELLLVSRGFHWINDYPYNR